MRVDLNLTNDDLKKQKNHLRIEAILPTIKFLIARGAKVVILSHRGRPKIKSKIKNQKSKLQFKIQNDLTLKPFAKILTKLLKKPVRFIDFKGGFNRGLNTSKIRNTITRDSIILLENLRFFPGERKNDKKFAGQLASLGDFYVNDAFSVSHRKNASVVAITKFIPSYAGLLLEQEIKSLRGVKSSPKPLVVILGGAKISDKMGVIVNFLKRADMFLTGGGVANTFFASQKIPVGKSLYEKKMVSLARRLFNSNESKIVLPIDSIIKNGALLDIGPYTSQKYAEIIKRSKTIVWSGPMGYIENQKFTRGSQIIAKAIIKSRAFAVIGGGETIAVFQTAQRKVGVNPRIFLSTGGGAMLEYLAGKKLPGIEALN